MEAIESLAPRDVVTFAVYAPQTVTSQNGRPEAAVSSIDDVIIDHALAFQR
jgi:hypothetical protein